jgi:CheY-like chemotaxis protein
MQWPRVLRTVRQYGGVDLPPDVALERKPQRPIYSAGPGRMSSGKTTAVILLVEDNPANQMLIEAVLQDRGYVINLAGSADEALASIQAMRPDLILMDIQLPGEDGLSLTRRLKADSTLTSIPVVALTAHAMVTDRKLSLEAGCVGYISKPIDAHLFADEVASFLHRAT